MSTALVPVAPAPSDSTAIAPAVNRAEAYARAAKAPATRKAYASDWAHFQAWCDEMGLSSLPVGPQTVAVYIAALAESHRPATIRRRMAAIEAAHKAVGLESPASMRNGAVASVWHGIRRTHGVAQDAKAPVLVDELRGMVRNLRSNRRRQRAGHHERDRPQERSETGICSGRLAVLGRMMGNHPIRY